MAGTATPIFPQTVKSWYAKLVPATGAFTLPVAVATATTNLVALAVGDTNGDKIESIYVTSTDTAAQSLVLAVITATDTFILGIFTIAIQAGGAAANPSVDILRHANLPGLAYDANGNRYLYLKTGETLYVGTLAAVTAAKLISVIANGGAF